MIEPHTSSTNSSSERALDPTPTDPPSLSDSTTPEPPACLPRVPKLFWSVHPDFEKLIEIAPPETGKVLDALGPPPFPKTGFPFIGFLATVYEHVSHHTQPLSPPETD